MLQLSLALLSTAFAPSQDATPESLYKELAPALDQVMAEHELPGLAVAILQGGEILFMKGFGTAERGTDSPVTSKSIFHMASVSKPFVATAVMLLEERGKLELDDKLVKHLPYFRVQGEEYRDITIRQVLQHTSGMPDVEDYEWDKPQTDDGAAERYVRSLSGESLRFKPGTSRAYSNMAFDVMGDLIAKVSGMSFDDFVETQLLDPLAMVDSSFIHARTPEKHRTRGHSNYYGPRIDNSPSAHYPYNRRHAPSSTLNSNLEDMCKWMHFNLSRGADLEDELLSNESFDLLFGTGEAAGTGLTWGIGKYRDMATVSHSGGDVGYGTHVYMVPDLDLGVVMMGNCDSTPVGDVTRMCLAAVAGDKLNVPKPGIDVPFARIFEADGFEAAMEAYESLRDHPTIDYRYRFGALDDLGWLLLRHERYEDAEMVLTFNLEHYPDQLDGLLHLAQALHGLGEDADARELLLQVLDSRSNDEEANALLDKLSD
jgi:CubicO group peptidase (beta-lactamase class C family)